MLRALVVLLVAFALAIAAFFASTMYTHHAAEQIIDEQTSSTVGVAVPSVERLSDARTMLRQLRTELRRILFGAEAKRRRVEAARRELDRELAAYLTLPFYPQEAALWHAVKVTLVEADRQIAAALAADPAQAVTYLDPTGMALDRVDDALHRLVAFNAGQAADAASSIRTRRAELARNELWLDRLAALLTVVTALLAARAVRQFARVQDERNRRQADRAQELEQFAGRVAHDIRGPLSSTSMALQLCLMDPSDDATQARLERGARGVIRVETIVDGLLRFARAGARPETGVRTRVLPVIDELVGDLRAVAAAQQIELRAEAVVDAEVACNSGVLASVLENLVRNAVKYMGDAPLRRVVVRAATRGEVVRFEVEDTGPGIAPDVLPGIFQPYVRGRTYGQPGIGLGLATVRRIAEAHGGSVRVQSSPAGSLFAVDMLCARA
jgi:signal transduction histidine kinase